MNDEQPLFSVNVQVRTSVMEISSMVWSWSWTFSTWSLKRPWCEGEPWALCWLVFLVRLTTWVGEEFPVVSETRNLLKIGSDHLAANPIRLVGGDPRSAKPFSLEKVTHLMRIQFAIKAESLWKNPITCLGNPFEEGTPFQRIRYRKGETHGVKVSH